MTSRRRAVSNERWNNVLYVNIEIYSVEQRQINFVFFKVDINNVRQRRNNAIDFNVDFHNVDQHRNNIVNMTIFKKLNKKIFLRLKKKMTHLINNTCFWLWTIKKKGRHRTYIIKVNVPKNNAWYMKGIGK